MFKTKTNCKFNFKSQVLMNCGLTYVLTTFIIKWGLSDYCFLLCNSDKAWGFTCTQRNTEYTSGDSDRSERKYIS
jgi:hypothetical protein